MKSPKPRNGGEWTEARFNAFIKSILRAGSNRWGPKFKVKKEAWVERGIYWCAGYNRDRHKVPATLPAPKGKKKRINNAVVDHISPVIDPIAGFQNWDVAINRMFCEKDGLQVLCHECHTAKTADERLSRKGSLVE